LPYRIQQGVKYFHGQWYRNFIPVTLTPERWRRRRRKQEQEEEEQEEEGKKKKRKSRVCSDRHYIYYKGGRKNIYYSEGLQPVPVRPTGKGSLEMR